MRFVHPFNLRMGGLFVNHIDVIIRASVRPGCIEDMDSPLSPGEFKIRKALPVIAVGKVQDLLLKNVVPCKRQSQNREKPVVRPFCVIHRFSDIPVADGRLQHPGNVQRMLSLLPKNIGSGTGKIQLFPLRMLFDSAICVSGRKMPVVQNPDIHPVLLRLVQDDIHIPPPERAAEIIVRPRFQADRLNPAFPYFRKLPPQYALFFTAHPEKWKNMIVHKDSSFQT